MGERGIHTSSPTRKATETPKSLWSCAGRLGDRDALWDNQVCIGSSHSRRAADTSESLRFSWGRLRDRDAPWENYVCTRPSPSHIASNTLESLRSCLGRLGERDAPVGEPGMHKIRPLPHNGGYTRVPPVLPRLPRE